MYRRTLLRAAGASIVSIGAATLFSPFSAKAADFSGKTIEWWIPFREGGGSDTWARALAPTLAKFLPGSPTIIIKNNAQSGAIGGTNEYFARMEPSGEMIFGTSGSVQFPMLLKDPRVRYNYKEVTPIFASPAGGVVYVPAAHGVKDLATDIDKLKQVDLKFGSQGATSLDLVPALAFEMLGLEVETILGFKSRANGRLSTMRGETTIDYQTTPAYLKHVVPLVDEGSMVPLFTFGALNSKGEIVRDPTLPDLPSFPEVYESVHGKKPSGPAWDAWKAFFLSGYATQKFLVVPKDTPKDIVMAYREAAKKMAADPQTVAFMEEELGKYETIVDGIDEAMETATNVSPEAEAYILGWLKDRFGYEPK
ncbi:tricarboxylate transporter [Pelagibius sp. 7325]|uniref:Bug family tripartite tricarboxylate transporter substrate binding protein n=1 Tax=Pelagibius sp. 7325 TaxID=3131994 RepID=UPI0030EEE305